MMTSRAAQLDDLETDLHVGLPPQFRQIFTTTTDAVIGPCAFYTLDSVAMGEHRWRGMLPQFVPFGEDDEENLFGLYRIEGVAGDALQVLHWHHEYDHYSPVASSFSSFVDTLLVHGQYDAVEQYDVGDPRLLSVQRELQRWAEAIDVDRSVLDMSAPRNKTELHERLARIDPQNSASLLSLGSLHLGRGDAERARDAFTRASEAAPGFADPYFWLALTYANDHDASRAAGLYWKVVLSPIALSTRTGNYPIAGAWPDSEISEVAVTLLSDVVSELPTAIRRSDLCRTLVESSEPFSPHLRYGLGERSLATGNLVDAEREFVNSLTLAINEDEIDSAYDALIALYRGTGRNAEAELCINDRELL